MRIVVRNALRRVATGAVALLLALAAAVVAAPAAHAEDLPTGTFKIVSSRGGCADVQLILDRQLVAIRNNCDTLDLGQQFISDLLTKQIRSMGSLGQCLEANDDFGPFTLEVKPCSNDVAGQKWGRTAVGGGAYNIKSYNSPTDVMSTAGVDIGDSIGIDFPINPRAPAYTWTFTLL